jgi:hypothetical protein
VNTRYDGWPPAGLGTDGAFLVGKQPKKELPELAKRFRKLLGSKGWSAARLHKEAVKRFGDDAAVAHSFRRLITKDAPQSDSKTVRQAEAILESAGLTKEPQTTLDQIAEDRPILNALAPIIGSIPAARDATEDQIVAESRRLMGTRHASLHALLTLLLSGHK